MPTTRFELRRNTMSVEDRQRLVMGTAAVVALALMGAGMRLAQSRSGPVALVVAMAGCVLAVLMMSAALRWCRHLAPGTWGR